MKAPVPCVDPVRDGRDLWHDFSEARGAEEVAQAKALCQGCEIREACLTHADALERDTSLEYLWGIWGGLTPRERAERRQKARNRG